MFYMLLKIIKRRNVRSKQRRKDPNDTEDRKDDPHPETGKTSYTPILI